MRKTEFNVSWIPNEAEEAQIGAFAIKLMHARVAVLYGDGAAFIVSLFDYTGDSENLPTEDDTQLTRDNIESFQSYLRSREEIVLYLNTASVPPGILKLRTAASLCGHDTLVKNTKFYRFTATRHDICFDKSASKLRSGSYLATESDIRLVNTGFGAVGRYSLPCPYPARFLQEYTIPKGTTIQVGTVEPQFRQSGGGVEAKLVTETKVLYSNPTKINDY